MERGGVNAVNLAVEIVGSEIRGRASVAFQIGESTAGNEPIGQADFQPGGVGDGELGSAFKFQNTKLIPAIAKRGGSRVSIFFILSTSSPKFVLKTLHLLASPRH